MTKFIRRFTAQRARRYKVSSGPIRSPKVANPSGSGPGAIRPIDDAEKNFSKNFASNDSSASEDSINDAGRVVVPSDHVTCRNLTSYH